MRFSTFFAKQARKPSGWFGRVVMSRIFDIGNARLNRLAYQTLKPQPGDHILELGCGTGKLIKKIARRTDDCIVEGIDFSDTMVAIARRKNKKHITKGKVIIHRDNFADMRFREKIFTKICSVNTIYFWPDPQSTLGRIFHLLKPGGMLVIGLEDIAQLENRRLDTGIFRLYSAPEIEGLLTDAGFAHEVATRSIGTDGSIFHCVMAVK